MVLVMVVQHGTWEVPGSPLRISLHINRSSFLSAPCKCVLAFSSAAKCCIGAYESWNLFSSSGVINLVAVMRRRL